MSTEALLVLDLQSRSVSATGLLEAAKIEALAQASLITAVNNPLQNQWAVDAQRACTEFLRELEAARKAAKDPILDLGRGLDATAKKHASPVEVELTRINRLIGDFQQVELAKARAEQARQNEEASKIERDCQDAISKATTIDEIERAKEEMNQRNAALGPVAAPSRVEGQQVREDWDFEVQDLWTLASFHRNLVKIEPKRGEIKEFLRNGGKVHGIRAWKVVKASVRTAKARTIEIPGAKAELQEVTP